MSPTPTTRALSLLSPVALAVLLLGCEVNRARAQAAVPVQM